MAHKPFSQACENNKAPIFQVLQNVFTEAVTVWEIGSGTGQHACHFAGQLPHLAWQPTDLAENIAGMQMWLDEAALANINPPLILDVTEPVWLLGDFAIDALFTANTLHIMAWHSVQLFFSGLAKHLNAGAKVCIYGPFNYQQCYTSESNAQFDQWLKSRDPLSGIRDFEAVAALALQAGLVLQDDVAMPANNRLLVFVKHIEREAA